MFTTVFAKAERMLAAVTALLLFTLNEIRMFSALPRAPEPAHGQTHAISVHVFGSGDVVYLSVLDLAARWGLVGLTLGLCAWAAAETLKRPAAA